MRMHHLAFRTHDLERLRRFYETAIGLRLHSEHHRTDGSLRSIWMGLEGVVLMLEAAEPTEPEPSPVSMEMVAFAIEDGEREAVRARLAAAGIAIEAETPFTLYVRDPDGRRIGLSSYVFPPGT